MNDTSITTNNQQTTDATQPVVPVVQTPVEPAVPAPAVPTPSPVVDAPIATLPEVPSMDALQSTVSVATPPVMSVPASSEAKPAEPAPTGEDLQQLTQQLMKDLQNMQTPGQPPTNNNQPTTDAQAVPAAPVVEASQPVVVPTVQPLVVEPVVSVPDVTPAPVVSEPVVAAPTPAVVPVAAEAASVTENKVTVYTTTNCPFCKAEKEYLFSKGLKYDEKNVETDEVALKDMLAMSDNFAGVPVTLLQNSKGEKLVVKGFTKDEFEQELVKLGMLTAPTAPSVSAIA